jgi:hypothetical protein
VLGDGPDDTILKFYDGYIYIRGIGSESNLSLDVDLATDGVKGANTIELTSIPSWLKVGYLYAIDELDDPTVVDAEGQEGHAEGYREIMGNGTRGMAQTVRVEAISGKTVTLDTPLYTDWDTDQDAQLYVPIYTPSSNKQVYKVGLEDLKLEYAYSDTGTNGIKVEVCDSCWLDNIESDNSPGLSHVMTAWAYRMEIRDSYFHDSHAYGSGQGYAIALYHVSSANLIENNVVENVHSGPMVCYGSSGNVIGYNYITGGIADSGQAPGLTTHGLHPIMNLWEGNDSSLKLLADFTHGSSSHNVLFRNRVGGYEAGFDWEQSPVVIEYANRSWSLVGNVLGVDGIHDEYEYMHPDDCDASEFPIYILGYWSGWGCSDDEYETEATMKLLRHGNYDSATDSTVWDDTIAEHTLPDSLYLSSKPTFWGSEAWPPIGPDALPMYGKIPARTRYEAGM